jgi:protein SCO1/2
VPLFDPAFVGLTGERAELEPVWKDYGVYQARQETGSAAGYLVDHSSRIYVIDKNGNWRETFSFGMDTDLMAQDVEALLREN